MTNWANLFFASGLNSPVKWLLKLQFMALVPIPIKYMLQRETGMLLWLYNNSCPHNLLLMKPTIQEAGLHPKSTFRKCPYALTRPHWVHRPTFFRRYIPEQFKGSHSKGNSLGFKGGWLGEGQGRHIHHKAKSRTEERVLQGCHRNILKTMDSFLSTCKEGSVSYLLTPPPKKCRLDNIVSPLQVELRALKDALETDSRTLRLWWLKNSETLIMEISGTFLGYLDI